MDVRDAEKGHPDEYSKFGDRNASPMYDFDECTFHPLTGIDRGYFKMLLSQPLWNLVVALQTWIKDNPGGNNVLHEAARKDLIKAWGLTALAQPAGVARYCCFLQMALTHEQNVDCLAHLV